MIGELTFEAMPRLIYFPNKIMTIRSISEGM